MLDTAEQRKTLLPEKPVDVPPLLARTDAQYAMIAGKNMFFGPSRIDRAAESAGRRTSTPPRSSASTASLPARTAWKPRSGTGYHNWEYKIARGAGRVPRRGLLSRSATASGTDTDRSGQTLALRDSDGNVVEEWQVVRIEPREVILRDDGKGKYFALHMGDYLAQTQGAVEGRLGRAGDQAGAAQGEAEGHGHRLR